MVDFRVNWEAVRAIVFDLGNVLLDLDNERFENGWPLDIGAADPAFAGWAQHQNLFYRYDTGQISSEALVATLAERLGLTAKQVTDYWNEILLPGINPTRYETLEKLKPHYPLYVLSNTNDLHIDWVREHVISHGHPDFEREFFVKTFYSQRLGSLKPEPSIYEQAQSGIGLPAEQLLFIDDREENVEEARRQGWQSVQLEPGRPVEQVLVGAKGMG